MLTLLIFCYLSEIVDSRTIAMLTLQIWALPLLIALYTFNAHTSQWVYFAVVSLIVGFPYVHPVQVAWASTNSSSVGGRTVSASLYNMFVQAGGIIAVSRVDNTPTKPADARLRRTFIGQTTRYALRSELRIIFTDSLSSSHFVRRKFGGTSREY